MVGSEHSFAKHTTLISLYDLWKWRVWDLYPPHVSNYILPFCFWFLLIFKQRLLTFIVFFFLTLCYLLLMLFRVFIHPIMSVLSFVFHTVVTEYKYCYRTRSDQHSCKKCMSIYAFFFKLHIINEKDDGAKQIYDRLQPFLLHHPVEWCIQTDVSSRFMNMAKTALSLLACHCYDWDLLVSWSVTEVRMIGMKRMVSRRLL